jgi:hypothetical protein
MNDEDQEPWVGTSWILIGIVAVWSGIACVALVLYWFGVFAMAILESLWGWL